jgi:DUF971 family protein
MLDAARANAKMASTGAGGQRGERPRTGTMMTTDKPWPTELRLHKDRTTLTVTFESGERYALSAEYLRVRSPSAEVQGYSPQERKTVPGKKYVQILEVQPVGNYAVRLVFDDTHATGIYSWDYLQELGRTHARAWPEYLQELASKGLSREPPKRS